MIMKKKYYFILFVLFTFLSLSGFPITDYDYHICENAISPITAAMGGINVTNLDDCALIYNNPALLSYMKTSTMIISAKYDPEEEKSFSEVLHSSNTLKDAKINYFSFTIDSGGFAYQPLAKINIDRSWDDSLSVSHKEYHNYYLDAYQLAFSEKNDYLSYGLNLKYLTGRMVYLKEHLYDSNWIKDEFIDSTVQGFSADLSFSVRRETYAYGLNFYDVFSKLYWKDHKNANLVRRFAFATQIMGENFIYTSGVSSRLEFNSKHNYHFGIQRNMQFRNQIIPIRAGVYSQKFDKAKNIFVSFGFGYYIGDNFRIDISATSNDSDIHTTKYLLSFSLNIQKD